MNKKIILLLCTAILLGTMVTATEDFIVVHSFKAYADESQLNVDWDDDEFYMEPGKTLKIQLRLENNYNITVIVDTWATLYDVGDDDKRTEKSDIKDDRTKIFVFEYYIPSSTNDGRYEIEVSYEYEYNNISFSRDKTFDLIVRQAEIDTGKLMLNLTQMINSELRRSNDLSQSLLNITPSLNAYSVCLDSLKDYEAKEKNSDDYKRLYDLKTTESGDYRNDFTTCNIEKRSMYTQSQMDDRLAASKRVSFGEGESKANKNAFMIGGAIALFMWWKKREKKVSGDGNSESIEGSSWG